MKKRNAIVAQSGGPTAVINMSLAGVVAAARDPSIGKRAGIGRIYGARHGIDGILKDDLVDLTAIAKGRLSKIGATPSAALGSSRRKPTVEDCAALIERFKARDIGWFFYIGGNDSADTLRIVAEESRKAGWPMRCMHVPKTIDNDLRSCDITPGYGSAARFVAIAMAGDDLDARALGGVKIDVVMGRDAGFLVAASALARRNPGDGPHVICFPEVPFSEEKFVAAVKAAYAKYGRCLVAVSEGIRGPDGVPVAAALAGGEKDPHGNIQLSGTGALGDALARLVREKTGIKRVRADTFGYLQRSFAAAISRRDSALAALAGERAVVLATSSREAARDPNYAATAGITYKAVDGVAKFGVKAMPIAKAARETRSMPAKFIARGGFDVTRTFVAYAAAAVGELPEIEVL